MWRVAYYLSKGTFSNERVDLVAVVPAFSRVHNVVMILIIVTIIDNKSLLLPSRQLSRLLFTSPLLCSHSLAVIIDLTHNRVSLYFLHVLQCRQEAQLLLRRLQYQTIENAASGITMFILKAWEYDITSEIRPCQLMCIYLNENNQISSQSDLKRRSLRLLLNSIGQTRITRRRTRWVLAIWDQFLVQNWKQ